MDVLDKYKETWKAQPEDTNKVSKEAIYKMTHKSSSSIVKWIFIIGILEFILVSIITYLTYKTDAIKIIEKLDLNFLINSLSLLHYIVTFIFLWMFYQNYKRISITDSTRLLIEKIKHTRKTVLRYMYYNIGVIVITNICFQAYIFSDIERLKLLSKVPENIDNSVFLTIMIVTQIVALIIVILIIWGLYKLVYGRLLKKLNNNYKELAKLEDEKNNDEKN